MKKSLEQQTKLQFPKPKPMPNSWKEIFLVKHPEKPVKTDKKIYTIPF